jgi:hypothetical protein
MAYYTYKQVRDLLPKHIIDRQGPNYEGDPGYDGDQWTAAADYINELKEMLATKNSEISRLKEENSRLRLLLNRP